MVSNIEMKDLGIPSPKDPHWQNYPGRVWSKVMADGDQLVMIHAADGVAAGGSPNMEFSTKCADARFDDNCEKIHDSRICCICMISWPN